MERINFKKLYITALLILAISNLEAQNTRLPYFNGFENPSDTAGWTFKKRPGKSGFEVGTATHCLGYKSMYISPDSGATATYIGGNYVSLAYKSFTLPAGTYQLAFDYQMGGDGTNPDMKVAWAPASSTLNSSAMGSFPNNITQFQFTDSTSRNTFGGSAWTHVTGTVSVPTGGGTYNLCFAFRSNSSTVSAPGACIDNIQLDTVKGNSACTKMPTNIQVVKDAQQGVIITWSGNAQQYEVVAASASDPLDYSYCRHTGITTTSDTMQYSELGEGQYFFYVRAICGTDTSMFSEISGVLIYNVSAHCIDFTTFNASGTTCSIGTYDNPYSPTGYLDNGPSQMSSRQTVHTDLNELDPRTNNALHTVPTGEVMSVRLGNWNNGAQAESITYTYNVPTGSSLILILKYAVVFQEPGHDEPPEFKLEIMNAYNVLLDASCTTANFLCDGTLSQGWHSCTYNTSTVWYKEWTTMGVNLTQYAGQTIKIRLTTKDCNYAGHFGYAYFTLGCQTAELTGVASGTVQSTEFKAPDGFNYSWTSSCTGQVVSTSQSLSIADADTCIYTCTCTFKENSSCSFTLGLPTNLVSESHTICQGETYSWRGRSLSVTGVFYDSVFVGQRCDSVFKLILTVNPKYEISFVDYDGTVLHRDTLCKGTMPQYIGALPTRNSTAQYSYTFRGWSPALAIVSGVATYTARYDSVIRSYSVRVNYDASKGSVTGGGMYNYGTSANLTATAKEDYHFVSWSNGVTNQSITFTVYRDTTLTATFALNQVTVTANANDEAMGSVTGGGVYDYGESVTLTATANEHYSFASWSNGMLTPTITITATEDVTLTAVFVAKKYYVVAVANYSNRGTVTGGGEYSYLDRAALTASPVDGYKFTGWSNGETSQAIFVTVEGDTVLTAYFEVDSTASAVEDVMDGFKIAVYPNPAHVDGTVYVEVSENVRMIEVHNADGKLVDRIETVGNRVEVKGMDVAGVYVVRVVRLNGEIVTRKVIVE